MRIRSIRASLVRTYAALVLLAIGLTGVVTLSIFKRSLLDLARENATRHAAQLARVIEDYVGYLDDIALVVLNDDDVLSWMRDPATTATAVKARIASFLASVRSVRTDIDGIFLLPRRGEGGGEAFNPGAVIASSAGKAVNPDFDFPARWAETWEGGVAAAGKAGAGPLVSAAHVENLVEGRYPWVVSLLRAAPGGRAWVQVDLNYAIIEGLCREIQLGKSGYVFIVDGSGDIVYHPRQQLVYGKLKTERIAEALALREGSLEASVDGRKVLYSVVPSPGTGWTIVAVSRVDELLSGAREAEYSFLMFAIACFALVVVISSAVSSRISRPIEALRRSMKAVESGNFDIDISVDARNEVWELARDCDIAVKKVRDLVAENRRDAERKRLLELRALQAQINPHFLYNTLDSIIWMIELGENDKAIEVTSALAKFFRLGINRGTEFITLRTEIEYLETYLSIQKRRYEKRLDWEISFDPAILGFRIQKLLVQPLVENAIYHGIKNKEGPGLLRIRGSREGDAVLIRVGDDGVGMDEARLAALRLSLEGEQAAASAAAAPPASAGAETAAGAVAGGGNPSNSSGVGARNVQDRIRLSFGPGYGLSFDSVAGEGTTATIRIPVLEEDPS